MRLLAIGRMRAGPEAELFARYTLRLRPPLMLTQIAEAAGVDAKRRDNAALRGALPRRAWAVALDSGGLVLDSAGFAQLLQRWRDEQLEVCFLIGGADGLDAATLDAAAAVLSLGALTWPHMLARAMLAEQLYRAQSIAAGHPYHRVGRPA